MAHIAYNVCMYFDSLGPSFAYFVFVMLSPGASASPILSTPCYLITCSFNIILLCNKHYNPFLLIGMSG